MRRFRFRLARLLELRERAEGTQRDRLAAAREAVRATQAEIEGAVLERTRARLALADVEAPGAAVRRAGLILYAEALEGRLAALEAQLGSRRRSEEEALQALFLAVRERKVLTRLRERRRLEHLRAQSKSEQAALDDLAQRSHAWSPDSPGTAFPARQDVPGAALS